MKLPELTSWWLIAFALRGELIGGAIVQSEHARLPDQKALAFTDVKDADLQVSGWMLDTWELDKVRAGERALTKEETIAIAKRINLKESALVP